ncbi:MAG TPA: hydrogenase [Phycisphaerae bacterium]|nr:hydrogenase [Phycisphaerae bacterium]HRY71088.1 hydrogenase [Phycisphaerae bacterium]HSA29737.1 hydrogenase [Phycisphaerae bacterium]
MAAWTDLLLILIALTNLAMTGLSSLGTCIRVMAIQGVMLGFVTIGVRHDAVSAHILILVVGVIVIKGLVFPRLLLRGVREANVRREVEPFIGFTMSLLIGTLGLPAAIWLGSRLPAIDPTVSPLVVPVAFHAILIGLFLIVSRKKAVTQVLGYLGLENGIYIFGIALVKEATILIDLGVLLDIFVAVFVMGIAIFHISREFDHIDTDRLSTLKE